MIANFYIEENYMKNIGLFNKIYSINKKIITNDFLYELNLSNVTCYGKRKLYILDDNDNDNFYNTIEITQNKEHYICHKYVTKLYYDTYKNIYDKLFEYKFYDCDKYKIFETKRLDHYIYSNFNGRDSINGFNTKYKFIEEQIHDKINIDKLKFITRYQELGTFIDYCVKYIINNNYDFAFSYLLSCNKTINYDDLPENLEHCKNTNDLINLLFEKDFVQKILKIKEIFLQLDTTQCYINFDLLIYGEPDLISNDYIIDIKISKNNKINTKSNFLQSLFYALVTNKKNICLYDPINGIIYKYELTEQNINDGKNYIKNKNII